MLIVTHSNIKYRNELRLKQKFLKQCLWFPRPDQTWVRAPDTHKTFEVKLTAAAVLLLLLLLLLLLSLQLQLLLLVLDPVLRNSYLRVVSVLVVLCDWVRPVVRIIFECFAWVLKKYFEPGERETLGNDSNCGTAWL